MSERGGDVNANLAKALSLSVAIGEKLHLQEFSQAYENISSICKFCNHFFLADVSGARIREAAASAAAR